MPNPLITENASNTYVTTYVARLWAVVGRPNKPTKPGTAYNPFSLANHRYFTHFGEGRCCMSSIHSVVEAPAGKRGLILMAISKALFDLPTDGRTRLEGLWVDDLVYSSAWPKFVSESAGVLQKTIWVSKMLKLVR
jgi:hypothetical protein